MAQSKELGQDPPPYLLRFVLYHTLPIRRPDWLTCDGYVQPLIEKGLLPADYSQFSVEIQLVRAKWRTKLLVEIYERTVEKD